MTYILPIMTNLSICCTLLVFSMLICEALWFLIKFKDNQFIIHRYSVLYAIKLLFCISFVLWYDMRLNVSHEEPLVDCIRFTGVQCFLMAVGLSFMRESTTAKFKMMKHRHHQKLSHTVDGLSKYDNVTILRH